VRTLPCANRWACCGWLTIGAAFAQVPPSAPQPLILDVWLNGQPQDATRPVLRHDGRLLFTTPDLQAWRLTVPATPTLRRDGIDYHDLGALAGVRVTLDEASQTARIEAPPDAFAMTATRAPAPTRAPLSASAFGTFLNYDVALQHDRRGTAASGYFDAAASGAWGVAATSFVAGQSAFSNDRRGATRLDTTWRYDDPERLTRFSAGDSISRNAAWSTPFRFGGVQFGTRFGLQAGYIAYPTPTLRGGSAVPSALEVYVNDTLRYQGRVDPGPFAISEMPVLTGAGEMRFAVTDALGVQRTVTTPYYVSPTLLRAGLSDYSVEAGWTRLRYGERSFDYGRPFVSGDWRHGLSDAVTLELHAEGGARSQTAGTGVQWVWAPIGQFSVHAAASRSAEGSGTLARAAFSRSSGDWNFAASRQVASSRFTQVGWEDSQAHLAAQSQLFAGRSFGRLGTLGASYTLLRYNTDERVGVLSASWSVAVADRAWLSAYAARTRQNGQRQTTSIGLTLTLQLGERQSASLSLQRERDRNLATAEISQIPPSDTGYGYRLLVGRDGGASDRGRAEARVDWRASAGMVAAEAAQRDGQTGLRLRASGAVGYAGGVAFATRQSADAFALVTVPGAPGVQVYRENQPWTKTDSAGRAIVSGLRAYEPNRISIDNTDLPISAQVRNDVLLVVPRDRGVAAAAFDISHDAVVNVTVRLPDGSLLPPGIDVHSATRRAALTSGYRGTLEIEAPRAGERFEARWRGGHCGFTLGPALPSSGPYTCEPLPAPAATAPPPAR